MRTLQEQKRQTTADHLVASALAALVERGVDVTVDDVAKAAGVSRRTVFRHFPSRDELLAAAIRSALAEFTRDVPHYDEADWEGWLVEVCAVVHDVNSVYGQVELDFGARRDLPPPLADAMSETDRYRRTRNARLAERLWGAAGREGRPPGEFVRVINTYTSPFFTQAVLRGGGGDKRLAVRLAHGAILAALAQ
ncbi:MAG TPA: TetR/AcrR family transcriptional regulator [Kutzneria sp.]|nr:TetR/AcrR family transcriptional regulator [Kutzneria sp.]